MADSLEALEQAEIYWLSTVRSRRATPRSRRSWPSAWTAWPTSSSGPGEQKVQNLAANAQCILMTGTNKMDSSLDVVLEGEAIRVIDDATLAAAAAAYNEKYEEPVPLLRQADGVLNGGGGGDSFLFRIEPAKAFCFGRGHDFSQTRYRFDRR